MIAYEIEIYTIEKFEGLKEVSGPFQVPSFQAAVDVYEMYLESIGAYTEREPVVITPESADEDTITFRVRRPGDFTTRARLKVTGVVEGYPAEIALGEVIRWAEI